MRTFTLDHFLLLKEKIKKQNLEIKIISGSMEPFIGIGEKIKVKKVNNLKCIKKFDPIVFFQNEKLICHMFIKAAIKDDEILITTRGLNSSKADKDFSHELILGKVVEPSLSLFKRTFLKLFFK